MGMRLPEMGWLCAFQLKEETERLEEEEGETRKKMKATREHTKKWWRRPARTGCGIWPAHFAASAQKPKTS